MSDLQRDFKGIWIPREIWFASDLNWTEKLLLVEIDSLSNLGKCFASNDYFAQFFNLSKDRISKLITGLRRKGYIEVEINYNKNDNEKVTKDRIITTWGYRQKCLGGIGENAYRGIGENAVYNNTDINNTLNIYKERKKEETKPKKKTNYDEIVKAYTSNTELDLAIYEFIKMRTLIKRPLTDKALKIALNKLDKLGSNDKEKIEVLEQSIMNCWQGLFELKTNGNKEGYKNNGGFKQPNEQNKGTSYGEGERLHQRAIELYGDKLMEDYECDF